MQLKLYKMQKKTPSNAIEKSEWKKGQIQWQYMIIRIVDCFCLSLEKRPDFRERERKKKRHTKRNSLEYKDIKKKPNYGSSSKTSFHNDYVGTHTNTHNRTNTHAHFVCIIIWLLCILNRDTLPKWQMEINCC